MWVVEDAKGQGEGWKEARFVVRLKGAEGKEGKVVLSNGRAVMRVRGRKGRSML